jgi:hypothetical protein
VRRRHREQLRWHDIAEVDIKVDQGHATQDVAPVEAAFARASSELDGKNERTGLADPDGKEERGKEIAMLDQPAVASLGDP